MKKFYMFVGTRPNYMKAAPLCNAFTKAKIPFEIYHTGQHYDTNMSSAFFNELKVENVHHMPHTPSGNSIKDIQNIIARTNKILGENYNDVRSVIVFGDVSSTYAVALAAKGLALPIIHVESGLRSFDIRMPEELFRISIDHLSEILFATSEDAVDNLTKEGIESDVFMVGNIMIDSLVKILPRLKKAKKKTSHIVATFHRPENVDNEKTLTSIVDGLEELAEKYPIFFFIHPRTQDNLGDFGLWDRMLDCKGITLMRPYGYIDFIRYIYNAEAVVTDSGGIQEETTYLKIPCYTVRKSTERPVTIREGSNQLITPDEIGKIKLNPGESTVPKYWDGKTAGRIIDILNTLT